MAPAASTPALCPYRPAHGALAITSVHVAPAANARDPTDAKRKGARVSVGPCGPSYTHRRSPPGGKRRPAPLHTQRTHTHTHTHTHTPQNIAGGRVENRECADGRIDGWIRIKAHMYTYGYVPMVKVGLDK